MMSKEEEKKVLEDLENNIPYDYCRSCDSPDGLYHEYIDEDSWQYKIKILLEEKDKEIEFHKNNEQIAIDCQNKLSEEIERLNNIIKQQDTRNSRQRIANRKLLERNQDLVIENLKLNNIINEALEKSKGLQYRFGYVLDDLVYLLMQGSDKE